MSDLHALFEPVLSATYRLERETPQTGHPLNLLFSTLLKEQQTYLEQLLPKLQRGMENLNDCKKEVSIIYHDDEMLDSYFRAWLRHLNWSSDPISPKAEELLPVIEDMRSRLEEAAQALEDRFGYDAVKYVVPAFYFPTLR